MAVYLSDIPPIKRRKNIYMGMSTKSTTASNLQKAIKSNLVTIKLVTVESKDNHETSEIPAEQFKNDLDFYMESGVFADSIDFKYELHDKDLTVYAGNMSCYCDVCITVEIVVNDGVSKEDLENVIRKVDL